MHTHQHMPLKTVFVQTGPYIQSHQYIQAILLYVFFNQKASYKISIYYTVQLITTFALTMNDHIQS